MAPGPGLTISIDEKRFGGSGAPLFSGFRAELAPGSVTAIWGPSGVGKSTLLRMIAGTDRDYSGTITIGDLDAEAAPPPGFVFQDPRLLPWLTTLDNVRVAGAGVGAEAAMVALSKTGLASHGQLYPHQLSGGMQRRAALARALALNSRLLLLDEPFVSLDRALVEEMYRLIEAVIETERPTILFVTHITEDAARLADRVIVLAGRPARIGADLTLTEPRSKRDRTVVEAYRDLIERSMRR